MIDVLHIYEEHDNMAARYVSMLTAAMDGMVASRVATTATIFKQLAYQHRPDIVHVHTRVPFSLDADYRLVVTPHGQPLSLANAYAIVARSQMERDSLAKQHERIEIVLNPIITRTTTANACARQMLTIYQKVMRSSVLRLMDKDTRRLLAELLCAAIFGDKQWVDVQPHQANMLLLYLYAEREGILPYMEKGGQILDIDIPQPAERSGYLPTAYQPPMPMKGKTIVELITDIKENGPSLLRLVEIALALGDDELDEAKLLAQLDENRLKPLFASVLKLLEEQVLFKEGFMPCSPIVNGETHKLHALLANRQNVV